jgi:hypothetical protein
LLTGPRPRFALRLLYARFRSFSLEALSRAFFFDHIGTDGKKSGR